MMFQTYIKNIVAYAVGVVADRRYSNQTLLTVLDKADDLYEELSDRWRIPRQLAKYVFLSIGSPILADYKTAVERLKVSIPAGEWHRHRFDAMQDLMGKGRYEDMDCLEETPDIFADLIQVQHGIVKALMCAMSTHECRIMFLDDDVVYWKLPEDHGQSPEHIENFVTDMHMAIRERIRTVIPQLKAVELVTEKSDA